MQPLPMPKIGTDTRATLPTVTVPRAELEANRGTMLSLPAWAKSRIAWLGTVTIDKKTTHYLTTGLPQLTDVERAQIEPQLQKLEALVIPTAADDKPKLVLITKMLMAMASGQTSEIGAQARGEAYLFAVGEVPAWSVDEAVKNWYAGKVRDIPEQDLKWAPAPAVLLRASRDVLAPYHEAITGLRRLIAARPLLETLSGHR